MRTRLTAIAVTAALAVTLSACGAESNVNEGTAAEDTAAETTAPEDAAEPAPEETTEPAPEPEPEPEPVAEKGTRENPAVPGVDTVTFSQGGQPIYEVRLGPADWDAGPEIAAENQFNDEAPAGMVYVLLPLSFTYLGDETGLPWIDFTIKYVTADGRSFDSASAVIPRDIMDVSELYTGGVGEGQESFLVPADATTGGTWAIDYGFVSDTIFFAAI